MSDIQSSPGFAEEEYDLVAEKKKEFNKPSVVAYL